MTRRQMAGLAELLRPVRGGEIVNPCVHPCQPAPPPDYEAMRRLCGGQAAHAGREP